MKQRIKILFTIPNFDTAGSGRVVYDLVRGLDRSLFEPHICCTHSKGDYFKVVQGLGVPIHIFPFYTSYKPYISLFFRILRITRFFKKHQFDIIHSWHWSSDVTEPLAAKLAGIPYVYTKKAMGWGNRSWLWRSQLSTKIIAINTDMMRQFFSNVTHKTVYMPLGIDTNHFTPLARTRSLPNGFVFKDADFVIVSIANLAPVKGIEVLMEAVKGLNKPEVRVLVVGDHQNAYGKTLLENYSSSNIYFIDKQIDVQPFLAVADVFVIPTLLKGEGMPAAPIEAMASGRIVIGSKVSGVSDILEPFSDCLFEAGNIIQLQEKLIGLIYMTDEKRMSLEKTMRAHVLKNYSLYDMISSHEAVYRSLSN